MIKMKPLKYVYFISCQGYGYDGFFKLGVTSDYKRRYSEINKNIPFFTVLSCVVEHSDPLHLEYNTFNEFKSNRYKGEWFYTMPKNYHVPEDPTYKEFSDAFDIEHKKFNQNVVTYLTKNCDGRVIING